MKTNDKLFHLLLNLSLDEYSKIYIDEKAATGSLRLFSAIIASGVQDRDYLSSEAFWHHCTRLRLTSSFVLAVIDNINKGLPIINDINDLQ